MAGSQRSSVAPLVLDIALCGKILVATVGHLGERQLSGGSGAWNLLGKTLDDGWEVIEAVGWDPATFKLTDRYDGTGGNFSVSYKVKKGDRVAFLKAIDLSRALRTANPMLELQHITAAHQFETDILNICAGAKMDRVVIALASGSIRTGENLQDLAPYLIFDLADGDVRRRLQKVTERNVRVAWWMRSLHHTAIGLNQLHTKQVTHQDIKPSNILSFSSAAGFKIADLGRAQVDTLRGPHSGMVFSGDPHYAPLEILYGAANPDLKLVRTTSDLYMLGSMIFFFCLGFGLTQKILSDLAPDQKPYPFGGWTDMYGQISPLLQNKFTDQLSQLEESVSDLPIGGDLLKAAAELCNPDPVKRGHPLSHASGGNPYSLERYISLFDALAKRSDVEAKVEK